MNLRPMKFDDADFLLEMKNYPETRKYAIVSKEEIKIEDHLEWLKDNIQYFQIIESYGSATIGNIEIGAIRIENNEISIWIKREYWAEGFATLVLKTVSKVGMIAKIVEGNVGSMRAFIGAGFKPAHYRDNYYIFQK